MDIATTQPSTSAVLAAKLMARVPGLTMQTSLRIVEPLVHEAEEWLTRMEWSSLGVRPILVCGILTGAHLCDHTLGCDCGAH
jgi:hypothetical protein